LKSICFFSSYFEKECLPYYLKSYLNELMLHFDKVVLISNNKSLASPDIHFLHTRKIEWMPVKNEGYDYGMWWKAFNHYPVSQYERVGLINDSCVLFSSLNHVFNTINKSDWDYCGILDSMQIAYHLQSYFIVINERAIAPVAAYFKKNGIKTEFNDVIRTYEVGLTQYLLKNNFKAGAVYSGSVCDRNLNPSFFGIKKLIEQGFPVLKKKIIFGNYRKGEVRHLAWGGFDFCPYSYFRLIERCNSGRLIIDPSLLKNDFRRTRSYAKLFFESMYWRTYYKLRNTASLAYRRFIK